MVTISTTLARISFWGICCLINRLCGCGNRIWRRGSRLEKMQQRVGEDQQVQLKWTISPVRRRIPASREPLRWEEVGENQQVFSTWRGYSSTRRALSTRGLLPAKVCMGLSRGCTEYNQSSSFLCHPVPAEPFPPTPGLQSASWQML